MRTEAIIMMAAFLLSGCAGSISRLHERENQASQVYTVGSGFSGDGSSLLLFGDGHFERWGYSDIEAGRSARGRFTRSGNRILLFVTGKESRSLFVHNHQGIEYLAEETASEQKQHRTRNFNYHTMLKKREVEHNN